MPDGYYQKPQTEGSHMGTVPSVLGRSRISNLLRWTLLRGRTPKWIFHNLGSLLHSLGFAPESRTHIVPTEFANPNSSWRLHIQDKDSFKPSATVSPPCANLWLAGPCSSQSTGGSSIGNELDEGPIWWIEDSEPCVCHYDRSSNEQLTEKYNCRCPTRY